MDKIERLKELLELGYKEIRISSNIPGDPNAQSPLIIEIKPKDENKDSIILRFEKREEIIQARFIVDNLH